MDWDKCQIAAKLSAIAYMDSANGPRAATKLGYKAKLVSKGGAEMLVATGKTDLWIAFRGTEPAVLNDVLADLKVFKNTAAKGGKVHGGFQNEVNDLWLDVVDVLAKNDKLKNPRDVYYTGHSLGAAMATISAHRISPKALFTFGSPRVGGPIFVKSISCPHTRCMNNNDIVCRIPPAWLGFRHHGDMIYFNRDGELAPGPTWTDAWYGILNSWKRFKFFDGVVDHGMPNYVKAITKQTKK
jgi:triacylglycerol lipase